MSETAELLLRWANGDDTALAEVVARDAPWIEQQVRNRLGNQLRQRVDTQDIVQDTLLTILRTGPRFVCSDRNHLRALLARMVENTIRGAAHHHTARKRDVRAELRPAATERSHSVLMLDQRAASVTDPGQAAVRAETRDWMRLALELLEPDDRHVILWREFEGLPFAEVGARLGMGEDAARMRFGRALPKLARKLEALRKGELGTLLGDRAQ
ncbi:MAG TPA: sigma-70 family RNA polymerase sigma factor [Planctomycetota bacterium]|nr:sigma-70 family RNA polymerase sigma factor [Planctomycetota bacterium]